MKILFWVVIVLVVSSSLHCDALPVKQFLNSVRNRCLDLAKRMLRFREKQSDQQNFANNGQSQQNRLNPPHGNEYSGAPYSMSGNPNQNSNLKQNHANGYSDQYHRNDNKHNIRTAENENQMIGQRSMNYADTKQMQIQRSNPQTQYGDGVRNGNQKVDGQRNTSIQEPFEWKVGYPENDGSNVTE